MCLIYAEKNLLRHCFLGYAKKDLVNYTKEIASSTKANAQQANLVF
jgi:hypothetical protein